MFYKNVYQHQLIGGPFRGRIIKPENTVKPGDSFITVIKPILDEDFKSE